MAVRFGRERPSPYAHGCSFKLQTKHGLYPKPRLKVTRRPEHAAFAGICNHFGGPGSGGRLNMDPSVTAFGVISVNFSTQLTAGLLSRSVNGTITPPTGR